MDKKNTWAQKLLSKFSTKGASETIKNKRYTSKKNKETSAMREKLFKSLTKNTNVGYGTMGRKNFSAAHKTFSNLVEKGNYKGAREYISEQDRKIKAQLRKK